ncbi:tetratricopeptide repeat protein [Aureivirga marina]|uniref:tetratricopeptide repeat protein n=1 Tax=Aureivirga marina TaxID=1182451 RepID=UPI0018CB9E73|nr:hypothetical protein [Aureivirga marina]
MKTFKDENPFTYRISQMQVLWNKKVSKNTQCILWELDREEVRMVKGFCMLEASDQGKIPDLFINFDVPFVNAETFGNDLTNAWISLWNDANAHDEIIDKSVIPNWDSSKYAENQKDGIWRFIMCMASFAMAIDSKTKIVLNLFPNGFIGNPSFKTWIYACLEKLPSNLRIGIVDLKERPLFSDIPSHIEKAVLVPNLNMAKAYKEAMAAGDQNDPNVGINLCIMEMAEATSKNNQKDMVHWGDKAISIAKKTKAVDTLATVYLAYGSNWFQFKKFQSALECYKKIEKIIGDKGNTDIVLGAILLQSYHFQAATLYTMKSFRESLEMYEKTAEGALQQKNDMIYIEALRFSAFISEKLGQTKEAVTYLTNAFDYGKNLDISLQQYSSLLLICQRLYTFAMENQEIQLKEEISEFCINIWGENWKNNDWLEQQTPQLSNA